MCMLKGIAFDDLDGGIDSGKGYRSLSHGDIPKVDLYGNADEECNAIIKSIRDQITAGIDPREICVVARRNTMLNAYKDALDKAGIDRYEIKRDKIDDRHMAGVRLATMHRVKGLEFTCKCRFLEYAVHSTSVAWIHKHQYRVGQGKGWSRGVCFSW